jgi:hypothetical protein
VLDPLDLLLVLLLLVLAVLFENLAVLVGRPEQRVVHARRRRLPHHRDARLVGLLLWKEEEATKLHLDPLWLYPGNFALPVSAGEGIDLPPRNSSASVTVRVCCGRERKSGGGVVDVNRCRECE